MSTEKLSPKIATKEYLNSEDELVLKVLDNMERLQLQIAKSTNRLYDLWFDENDKLPGFVYNFKFAFLWTSGWDYNTFYKQIKKWAEHKNVDPVKEMKYRTKELLLRDKLLDKREVLMIWFRKVLKCPGFLQSHYKLVQDFLKSIEEMRNSDVLITEQIPLEEYDPDSYEHARVLADYDHTLERLDEVTQGMYRYFVDVANFWPKNQLNKLSAEEQASYIVDTEIKMGNIN